MLKQRYFLVAIIVLVMEISPLFHAHGSAQKLFAKGSQELLILDNIEDNFHTRIRGFIEGFRYVTFVRQEYTNNKWAYHVIFTNIKPKPFERVRSDYNFIFPIPNISFTNSRDLGVYRLSYSKPNLTLSTVSATTVVQTTFDTKDFLEVPPR